METHTDFLDDWNARLGQLMSVLDLDEMLDEQDRVALGQAIQNINATRQNSNHSFESYFVGAFLIGQWWERFKRERAGLEELLEKVEVGK